MPKLDLSADLDVFLADFATAVATHHGDTFEAIFDAEYSGTLEDPAIDSTAPQLLAKSLDVTTLEIANGVELTIDGVDYVVRSVQPDGTGMTRLVLEQIE